MEWTPRWSRRLTGSLVALVVVTAPALSADPPSVKLALLFRPVQKTVVYETPKLAEYDKCKVQVERIGKTTGWIVLGANAALCAAVGTAIVVLLALVVAKAVTVSRLAAT